MFPCALYYLLKQHNLIFLIGKRTVCACACLRSCFEGIWGMRFSQYVCIAADGTGCSFANPAVEGGSSTAKTFALRATHIPLLIEPPTTTILWAKLENKPVPNSWGKEGSRHVALGQNAQNPGFALVDARLFDVKICLAKALDIIINKNKTSSLTVTGELQRAIFPSLQARKMCGFFFFPSEISRDNKEIKGKQPVFVLKQMEKGSLVGSVFKPSWYFSRQVVMHTTD